MLKAEMAVPARPAFHRQALEEAVSWNLCSSGPARNPPAHGSTVLLVRPPEFPYQGRFFVEEHEEVNESEQEQSQDQNRNRTLVEGEPDKQCQSPNVHWVADEPVGADGD